MRFHDRVVDLVLLREELQIAVDDVKKQVAKAHQVVAPALREQVEGILAREDHVALEVTLALLFYMLLACFIDEPLDEAKVYDTDPVLRVLIVRFVAALADEDVVQLEVVVGEAGLVDEP